MQLCCYCAIHPSSSASDQIGRSSLLLRLVVRAVLHRYPLGRTSYSAGACAEGKVLHSRTVPGPGGMSLVHSRPADSGRVVGRRLRDGAAERVWRADEAAAARPRCRER